MSDISTRIATNSPRAGRRRLLLCVAAVVSLLAFHTPTRAAETKKELTAEQRQKNLASFELIWKTVRDSHYDPKLGGVDWEAVRTELRPSLEKARSMDDAREVIDEMLGRLGHSHVAIIPASLYEDMQGSSAKGKIRKASQQAVPGFDIRMADGEPVVVQVSAGSAAAKAGVRPGWRISKINGESLAPMLARIRKALDRPSRVPLVQASAVLWRLHGEEGKEVSVTFLDGAGKEVTRSITLAKPKGNLVQLGQLPPTHVHFESRKVDCDIAYFHFNFFLDPLRVMKAFGDTVQENLKAGGFVLDLRGNPGGIAGMAPGLGGWFVDRPNLKLGTTTYRNGFHHFVINPREATYQGPLAILVDEFSMSTSEIMASGLQGLKRARIFGTRTPGAALPSYFLELPNGDRLQYVVGDYVSVNGKRLEGEGVHPDEVVPLDRKALLAGHDPALDAAVRWIRSQRGSSNTQQ